MKGRYDPGIPVVIKIQAANVGPPKNQPFGRIIQVMPMVGMVGGESAKLHNHSNQTVSTVARSPKHHKKTRKKPGA